MLYFAFFKVLIITSSIMLKKRMVFFTVNCFDVCYLHFYSI